MTAMDLSIVLVSYNARADLERCLLSLRVAPPTASHEIVVVDNQSSDGSAECARQAPGVRVIDAGGNLGFSAANNIGIRATTGAAILLLNSDTIVPPSAIDRLMADKAASAATVVGPRLVNGAGQAELSFGRMITPLNEWRQKRLVHGQERGDARARQAIETMTREARSVDWVSGACLLVDRVDAEAVGLLDERYFMYTEDVDFCAAIRARGGRVRFTPAAEVVHLRGRSASSAPGATYEAYRRSHLAFYRKHHPWLAPLLRLYLGIRGGGRGPRRSAPVGAGPQNAL